MLDRLGPRSVRAVSPAWRIVNVSAKLVLIGLLLYAVARPELPQFAGKAMGTRLITFGIPALLLPVIWVALRGRTRGLAYPHHIDLCLVAPFLIDTASNTANLYDSIDRYDELTHFVNWVPWTVMFGLALGYAARLPRWAHFGLVLGFGAVTHILWEEGEYLTFLRDSPELATAYTDTLGDLALSLAGSLTGALLTVTALWPVARGRSDAENVRGSRAWSGS